MPTCTAGKGRWGGLSLEHLGVGTMKGMHTTAPSHRERREGAARATSTCAGKGVSHGLLPQVFVITACRSQHTASMSAHTCERHGHRGLAMLPQRLCLGCHPAAPRGPSLSPTCSNGSSGSRDDLWHRKWPYRGQQRPSTGHQHHSSATPGRQATAATSQRALSVSHLRVSQVTKPHGEQRQLGAVTEGPVQARQPSLHTRRAAGLHPASRCHCQQAGRLVGALGTTSHAWFRECSCMVSVTQTEGIWNDSCAEIHACPGVTADKTVTGEREL